MWLSIVATVFLILAVILVLWAYITSERRASIRIELGRLSGRLRIECPICGNVYEAVPEEGMSKCPVCLSLNKSKGTSEHSSSQTSGPPTNQNSSKSKENSP